MARPCTVDAAPVQSHAVVPQGCAHGTLASVGARGVRVVLIGCAGVCVGRGARLRPGRRAAADAGSGMRSPTSTASTPENAARLSCASASWPPTRSARTGTSSTPWRARRSSLVRLRCTVLGATGPRRLTRASVSCQRRAGCAPQGRQRPAWTPPPCRLRTTPLPLRVSRASWAFCRSKVRRREHTLPAVGRAVPGAQLRVHRVLSGPCD